MTAAEKIKQPLKNVYANYQAGISVLIAELIGQFSQFFCMVIQIIQTPLQSG
jgi:hypothetical protein